MTVKYVEHGVEFRASCRKFYNNTSNKASYVLHKRFNSLTVIDKFYIFLVATINKILPH